MDVPLLDTNVILRLLLRDHPEHSSQAKALFDAIAAGDAKVQITVPVVFETVFILEKHYQFPRGDILENVLNLVQLPGIRFRGKKIFEEVFVLWTNKSISFIDAYHAVLAKRVAGGSIVTFDRDFANLPGVTRLDPSEALRKRKAA